MALVNPGQLNTSGGDDSSKKQGKLSIAVDFVTGNALNQIRNLGGSVASVFQSAAAVPVNALAQGAGIHSMSGNIAAQIIGSMAGGLGLGETRAFGMKQNALATARENTMSEVARLRGQGFDPTDDQVDKIMDIEYKIAKREEQGREQVLSRFAQRQPGGRGNVQMEATNPLFDFYDALKQDMPAFREGMNVLGQTFLGLNNAVSSAAASLSRLARMETK